VNKLRYPPLPAFTIDVRILNLTPPAGQQQIENGLARRLLSLTPEEPVAVLHDLKSTGLEAAVKSLKDCGELIPQFSLTVCEGHDAEYLRSGSPDWKKRPRAGLDDLGLYETSIHCRPKSVADGSIHLDVVAEFRNELQPKTQTVNHVVTTASRKVTISCECILQEGDTVAIGGYRDSFETRPVGRTSAQQGPEHIILLTPRIRLPDDKQ